MASDLVTAMSALGITLMVAAGTYGIATSVNSGSRDVERAVEDVNRTIAGGADNLDAAIRESSQRPVFPEGTIAHKFDGRTYMCVPVGYEGKKSEEKTE